MLSAHSLCFGNLCVVVIDQGLDNALAYWIICRGFHFSNLFGVRELCEQMGVLLELSKKGKHIMIVIIEFNLNIKLVNSSGMNVCIGLV